MTTTIFRNDGDEARMASDSRVSLVSNGLLVKWIDSPDFCKTIVINGVLYGFAGANIAFKWFLSLYDEVLQNADHVLDLVTYKSKLNNIQFNILKYDGELKLFANSPKNDFGQDEIYRLSTDAPLDVKVFAIGSGKNSKMYKAHKTNRNIQLPIFKIKTANERACKQKSLKEAISNILNTGLDAEVSKSIVQACHSKGGDIFTGGEVKMTNLNKNVVMGSKTDALQQVQVMDELDKIARNAGAVCASPIDAAYEIRQLKRLGQSPVSKGTVTINEKDRKLLKKMDDILLNSIN
ncbi:hypothetical protein [Catenovulum sediminis]|uniref:hypothetical protein n=1 Tax=Catenovulum sediminis TaxID=1740262 RepID=UPI00117ED2FE|nr:hypothetical protein [Catenovulum sediminis]